MGDGAINPKVLADRANTCNGVHFYNAEEYFKRWRQKTVCQFRYFVFCTRTKVKNRADKATLRSFKQSKLFTFSHKQQNPDIAKQKQNKPDENIHILKYHVGPVYNAIVGKYRPCGVMWLCCFEMLAFKIA